jgi:hypothetical protein
MNPGGTDSVFYASLPDPRYLKVPKVELGWNSLLEYALTSSIKFRLLDLRCSREKRILCYPMLPKVSS